MKNRAKELKLIISSCPEIIETLVACDEYGLKDYYLAGGAITQLIWNSILDRQNLARIKDFDIVYYSANEDRNLEKHHQSEIGKRVDHKVKLDIVNQAFVHEWYPKKYGNTINPFRKTEDGIDTWLSAFAIGIRQKDGYEIYAPFGLEDAFNMIVRPNKKTMNRENYLRMTSGFKRRWDEIEILPWD